MTGEKEFYKQTTLTDISSPKEREGPIPAKIGPYKIESLLSKGGMSVIYLGLHPKAKELIIVKVLSPEFVAHPEMIERFLKEAKIIEMTNHPNIVKLYGQGTWDGGLYIAMEFIRGVSLKQFIIQQSLSLKRSIDIILQVAYALLHLHSHGVIHGDLKPENILITEDGEVKVIDFGIARLREEIGQPTKIAGTPTYMAPEQKENPAEMAFSSDIYSLGIIAYELAMGKLSFGVIHPSLLPKGLRKIIQKMLAISIDERYQDITTFITDLSQYLKSGGLEKDKPGTDQLKEALETIQIAVQSLSPGALPSWQGVEIGVAKYRSPTQGGSYFDFFKFPDNTYGVVIAESTTLDLNGAIYIAVLRGMIRTLLKEGAYNSLWIARLNQMIKEDWIGQRFSLAFLKLNPMLDTLSLTICGVGGVIFLPQGSSYPRKFSSQNPILGSEGNFDFLSSTNNWNIGDTLTFHSLDNTLETLLIEAVSENNFLSAQTQADAIIKKAATHPTFPLQKNPKIVITLQRIG